MDAKTWLWSQVGELNYQAFRPGVIWRDSKLMVFTGITEICEFDQGNFTCTTTTPKNQKSKQLPQGNKKVVKQFVTTFQSSSSKQKLQNQDLVDGIDD